MCGLAYDFSVFPFLGQGQSFGSKVVIGWGRRTHLSSVYYVTDTVGFFSHSYYYSHFTDEETDAGT